MSMFKLKVEQQRRDLLRCTFRNLYLKERLKNLETECKLLTEKLISSQVDLAEKCETNLKLKNDVLNLQKEHGNNVDQIDKAKENVDAILAIFREKNLSRIEDKELDANLEFRASEITCLQEHLVKLRLIEAEKEDTIQILKQSVKELENDKEMLIKIKPDTIAHHQEQLMMAKGRAIVLNEEFKQLKNCLKEMKRQVDEHVEKLRDLKTEKEVEGSVSLSFLGALWQSDEKNKKDDENIYEMRIKSYEDEIIYLKNEIVKLEEIIDNLSSHIQLREEKMKKLQCEIDSVKMKRKSNENILAERRRQCSELENRGREKYNGIKSSSMTKNENIGELARKVDELSNSQNNSLTFVETSEENMIKLLQDEIQQLEIQIKQLRSECSSLEQNHRFHQILTDPTV